MRIKLIYIRDTVLPIIFRGQNYSSKRESVNTISVIIVLTYGSTVLEHNLLAGLNDKNVTKRVWKIKCHLCCDANKQCKSCWFLLFLCIKVILIFKNLVEQTLKRDIVNVYQANGNLSNNERV